jgi:hypothetical protein
VLPFSIINISHIQFCRKYEKAELNGGMEGGGMVMHTVFWLGLHIALVILSVLNAVLVQKKILRISWTVVAVCWLACLVLDVLKIIG